VKITTARSDYIEKVEIVLATDISSMKIITNFDSLGSEYLRRPV